MAAFPGSLAVFAGFTSSHSLAADNHAAQHNLEQAEIVAVQTKVGTGSSTAAASTVLRGTGAGASAWGQVALTTDVTGVLPIANGGTGQGSLTGLTAPSAVLANPTITGTVTGGATYTSPVLTTPTISDFTNANHDHSAASKGGSLGSQVVTFANLLSTIFSGQVTTYTNAGSAGGTSSFFYINLGGIKLFWGTTGIVATGSNYNVTLPAGFFTTVQTAFVTPGPVAGTSNVEASIGSLSTTTLNFNSIATTGSGNFVWQILVIGT